MRLTKTQTQLKKRAIVMDIGGFRPPEDPLVSWFGKVNICLPGEGWPQTNGKPMHALCQINLTELPFKTPHLDDLAMITVFIGPDDLPVDQTNGDNWCLRAYTNLTDLVPLTQPPGRPAIKSFPLRARVAEADFPCLDEVSEAGVDVGDEEEFAERCPNVGGLKFGGWPTLIQSTIDWPATGGAECDPKYVFQIDSCQKAQWQWGDGGVGYFGRSGKDRDDQWVISWQCL